MRWIANLALLLAALTASAADALPSRFWLLHQKHGAVAPPPPPPSTAIYDTAMGSSVDSNGFAALPLRSGAHIFFVKNSGSDANSCASAQSPTTPKATLASAITCVTAGAGDQVLLAEGSTFAEAIPWLSYVGGFSPTYPTVISSYDPADPTNTAKYGRGDVRNARPVLTGTLGLVSGDPTNYLAIKGLDFNPGNVSMSGLTFRGHVGYLLIENNLFRYSGFSFDYGGGNQVDKIIIRNNSLFGVWSDDGNSHTGGIYLDGVFHATIEDNVIYHTGWRIGASRDDNPTSAAKGGSGLGGGPTVFNHPIYLQTGAGLNIVRRNLMIDNAADGGIARSDIVWNQNVSIRSPAGTGLGGGPDYNTDRPNGVLIHAGYNLSLAAIDLNSTSLEGLGYTTSNGKNGSRVYNSILAYNTAKDDVGGNANTFSNSANFTQPSYMSFDDNAAFNWTQSGGTVFTQTGTLAPQVHTVYNRNKWDDPASGTNTHSVAGSFTNPYTEAALYVAAGYADLTALVNDVTIHPEKHVQRNILALAQAGYGITATPDTTAPVLSSPTVSSITASSATIGASTTEGNGTWHYIAGTVSSTPLDAQILFEKQADFTAAPKFGYQAVTATGAQTANLTGLTAGTTYNVFGVQVDAEGNVSNVVNSSFTTTAASTVAWAAATDWTRSNSNLTANRTANTGFWAFIRADTAKSAGTVIFNIDAIGGSGLVYVGLSDSAETVFPGNANSIGYNLNNGHIDSGASNLAVVATATTGDQIKIVKTAHSIAFYKQTGGTGGYTLLYTFDATGGGLDNIALYPSASTGNVTGTQFTMDTSAF